MSIWFFSRCVHARWPRASALDGISCNGSFFCVCRAVFPAAEMASCLILSSWGTIGSSTAGMRDINLGFAYLKIADSPSAWGCSV